MATGARPYLIISLMKSPLRLLLAFALLSLGLTARAQPAESAKPKTYTAALVVSNRAEAKYNDKVSVLEDLLSARLTDLGFKLLSRELIASNLRSFVPPDAPKDATSAASSASAEAAFLDQASAVRLAQNLGADYLLHASITSYAETKRTVTAYGNTLNNYDYTLRVTYKLLDANGGGSLTGDVAKATRTEQGSANASALIEGIFDDLLDQASQQITASLRTRRDTGSIAAATPAAKTVTITLILEAADLYIPDVRIGAENTVVLGDSKFKVTPLAASVEVDGVAVGTAPGKLTIKPGFSRLRITRDGYQPWERTISASEGQVLNVALAMTEAGLARFKESTAFINDLKNGAKLTDAEVKVLEGKAKSLENSFFKVDTKENFRFILPPGYQEPKPAL